MRKILGQPASSASSTPFRDRGAFPAKGAVLAVAGVEPGLVGEPVEQLVLDAAMSDSKFFMDPDVLPTPRGNSEGA